MYKIEPNQRTFTAYATEDAKNHLNGLLTSTHDVASYREHMTALGKNLAYSVIPCLHTTDKILIVSTAEDADFLQQGLKLELQQNHFESRLAVFWNHHYQLSNQSSVAPIMHRFLETGYETSNTILIVKSIISGSCVIRTNLIDILDKIKTIENIFILAPVIHKDAENALKKAFPQDVADKFKFFYLAQDDIRTESGEVIPGIGGQIYRLLGLTNQPVLTSYIPQIVTHLAF